MAIGNVIFYLSSIHFCTVAIIIFTIDGDNNLIINLTDFDNAGQKTVWSEPSRINIDEMV